VKITGSALMSWLQFGSEQGASFDCNESDLYLHKICGLSASVHCRYGLLALGEITARVTRCRWVL